MRLSLGRPQWIRLSRHLAATALGVALLGFAATAIKARSGEGLGSALDFSGLPPIRTAFADLAGFRADEGLRLWVAHIRSAESLAPIGDPALFADAAAAFPLETRMTFAPTRPDWRAGALRLRGETRKAETVITIRTGESLKNALARNGILAADIKEAALALSPELPPKSLKSGQKVTLAILRSPAIGAAPATLRLLGLKLVRGVTREIALTRGIDGDYKVAAKEKPLTLVRAHLGGRIDFSLYAAAQKAGLPQAMIGDLIKAYSYDVDFQRDIRKGDTFDIVFERRQTAEGEIAGTGRMLYASLTLSSEAMPIYYFEREGADQGSGGEYFKPNGDAVKKSLLQTPIDGARITSGFGPRLHPLLGYTKMHKGVDFGAPIGTPIFAAGNGKIVEMGVKSGYGNYIRIRHNDDYATAYAHCSRFAAGLKVGASVTQGEIIAYVGATGRVTGPHLHYEILVDGAQVNPKSVKEIGINKLAGRDLQRFKSAMAEIDAVRGRKSAGSLIATDPGQPAPPCVGGCVN